MAEASDELTLLRALVEAHAQTDDSGAREPILYLRFLGGAQLQHPGLRADLPPVDETTLSEMDYDGLLDVDMSSDTWQIVPTPRGRGLVETHDRIEGGPVGI